VIGIWKGSAGSGIVVPEEIESEEATMQFAVTALDYADGLEPRLAVRPRHLELIERLRKEGRCLYAARLVRDDGGGNSNGSLMIFDYPSVKSWRRCSPKSPT
jgi:uncharacterized protein YciI